MSAVLRGPFGRLVLGSTPLTIGRTLDNQFVVNDPQASSLFSIVNASGQNAILTPARNSYPVFINGQPLEPNLPHQLRPGDTMRVGETAFSYEEEITSPPVVVMQENPYQDHHIYEGQTPSAASPSVGQTIPADYGAPRAEAFMGREPSTPNPSVPSMYNAGPQWSQYQGSNAQQTPPPFAQPQGPGVSYGSPVSPVSQVPQVKRKSAIFRPIILILAVLLVLVAVGSAFAIYQFARPQPILVVSSQYMAGTTPAGSEGTSLHLLGYGFSSNALVNFLLDNNSIAGGPVVHSDADGNFTVDLPITSSWHLGTHKLTASDAGGNLTKNVSSIAVVSQGADGTPGPNGAPPDNTNFTVKVTVTTTGSSTNPVTRFLAVTSQPGHDSGNVCDATFDANQPEPYFGTAADGTLYSETGTYSCSGTYKGGKLSYTETVANDKRDFTNGKTCQFTTPVAFIQSDDITFQNAKTVNGTFTSPAYSATCSTKGGPGSSANFVSSTGTITGSIVSGTPPA